MAYIMALPKELRQLLDHYVNYEYWRSAYDIFYEISRCKVNMHNDQLKDEYMQSITKLFASLPIGIECSHSIVGTYTVMKIILKPTTLITRNLLLSIFESICDNLNVLFKLREYINTLLAKHNYKERWICVSYRDLPCQSKIISIN